MRYTFYTEECDDRRGGGLRCPQQQTLLLLLLLLLLFSSYILTRVRLKFFLPKKRDGRRFLFSREVSENNFLYLE